MGGGGRVAGPWYVGPVAVWAKLLSIKWQLIFSTCPPPLHLMEHGDFNAGKRKKYENDGGTKTEGRFEIISIVLFCTANRGLGFLLHYLNSITV